MTIRDVVSWSAMIGGCVQNGQANKALTLFDEMQQEELKPNLITMVSVLPACADLAAMPNYFTFVSILRACAFLEVLGLGKQIHGHIVRTGFESNVYAGSALLDIYAKCGRINDARQVFDRMHERNTISWNSMIVGYAQIGDAEECLKLFCQMQCINVELNLFTLAITLRACAMLAALELGKQVHVHIIKIGFELDSYVGLCKLNITGTRDAGYAQHSCVNKALEFFDQMKYAGLVLDHITFVGVPSACSNASLVDAGFGYFNYMTRVYGIMPTLEHYACMVDLLGRVGRLDEAENFINEMPFEPSALVWLTLLSAYRIHGNMDLGKWAAKCLLELEPQDAITYVLLSNISAAAGRCYNVVKVRTVMKGRGVA